MSNFSPYIEENISNSSFFVKTMPFLDHKKILDEIAIIRTALELVKPIPYEDFDTWFHGTIHKIDPHNCYDWIHRALKKYGRTDFQFSAMVRAVVCGKITDEDRDTCCVSVIDKQYRSPYEIPQLAIIFDPDTTREEIVEAFDKRGTTIKQYIKNEICNGFNATPLLKLNVNIEDIREQRRVYLAYTNRISKQGYGAIAELLNIIKEKKRDQKDYIRSKYHTYSNRVECSLRLHEYPH